MLIESFHSGHRGHRIYCSLHRPGTRLVRGTGVVLCNPLGHEYYRAHRSYVKLATQLAQLGFPVMRFDYTGSGDSEGERVHERLDSWLNEISTAAGLLRESEPVVRIALGGIRFGATLAWLAASRIKSANTLLLWDPALDGERHIADLQRLHHRMLGDMERFPRVRSPNECSDGELIGTEFSPLLLREISAVSPDTIVNNTDSGTEFIMVDSNNENPQQLFEGARRMKAHQHTTARDYGWDDVHRIGETIMDPEAIRHFSTSMSTIAA